jgi:hypothetical protein
MHEQIEERLKPAALAIVLRQLLANAAIAASRGGSLCLVKPRPQFLDFPLELGVVGLIVGRKGLPKKAGTRGELVLRQGRSEPEPDQRHRFDPCRAPHTSPNGVATASFLKTTHGP